MAHPFWGIGEEWATVPSDPSCLLGKPAASCPFGHMHRDPSCLYISTNKSGEGTTTNAKLRRTGKDSIALKKSRIVRAGPVFAAQTNNRPALSWRAQTGCKTRAGSSSERASLASLRGPRAHRTRLCDLNPLVRDVERTNDIARTGRNWHATYLRASPYVALDMRVHTCCKGMLKHGYKPGYHSGACLSGFATFRPGLVI